MKNRTFFSLVLLSVTSIFISACGKSDSQHPTSNIQHPSDSSLSTDNQQPSTINLVHNGNFEEGIEKPEGWTTKNQFLNDVTGWDTEVTHNSTHSLKIENLGGTDAYWQGQPIVLDTPTNAFEASVWTNAKDIKTPGGTFALVFDVYLKAADGRESNRRISVDLTQTTHDWEKAKGNAVFPDNIVKIIPFIYFKGNIGTVYADDMCINTAKVGLVPGTALFDSNTKGTFTKNAQLISDKNGEKIFELTGMQIAFNTGGFIPVELGKFYELSGNFKSASSKNSKLFFGYAPVTDDKKLITRINVNYLQNTEAKLEKVCSKGDTVLYIDRGLGWVCGGCIAFDVDISGKYSDLPNFNLSPKITNISKDGKSWKVELEKPFDTSYPEGTKIREHIDDGAGTYIYNAAAGFNITAEWTEYRSFSSIVQGLYPGTKYVQIIVFVYHDQSKEEKVDFKDIKMQEISF